MSVFGLASSVAALAKVKHISEKEVIDTFDFRLHYRLTSAFLFLCCILCTATSLFGDPISCIISAENQGHILKQIETFCWITSTFTVPRLRAGVPGKDVIAHNVGPDAEHDNFERHNYYQWVTFVLFFQGLMFYTPHWLWKMWEGGLVRTISNGMRGPQLESDKESRDKIEHLCTYLTTSYKMHTSYAIKYFLCVALNFINTIGNIFLINSFLGGVFLQYGTKVLEYTDQQFRNDAMEDVFPKITKCTFHKYGSSGSIVKIDAMCVLALNVLNEKIYIFLWFWLIILAIISGLGLLYTLSVLMIPGTRHKAFKRAFKMNSTETKELVTKLPAGDFLLLHFLGQNMRSSAFSEVLKQVYGSRRYVPEVINTKPEVLDLPSLYPNLPTFSYGKQ